MFRSSVFRKKIRIICSQIYTDIDNSFHFQHMKWQPIKLNPFIIYNTICIPGLSKSALFESSLGAPLNISSQQLFFKIKIHFERCSALKSIFMYVFITVSLQFKIFGSFLCKLFFFSHRCSSEKCNAFLFFFYISPEYDKVFMAFIMKGCM